MRGLAMAMAMAVGACTDDLSGRAPGVGDADPDASGDTQSSVMGESGDTGPMGSGATTGPSTATGEGPADDDDESDDAPPGTETNGSDETTTGDSEVGDWLLTIDNAAAPPALVRIDVTTGAGEPQCSLPDASTFNSLVLAPDGTLYVHNATLTRIERVDPCDCGFMIVGSTSAGSLEIGPDLGEGMFGVDTELDALYSIEPNTGLANPIGPLGQDFAGSAIAFSETLPGLVAIDDGTNQIYSVDTRTGAASLVATLSALVTAPGFAYRGVDDTFYVCEADVLYTLNVASGVLSAVGPIGLAGDCTSLAAPRGPNACLD